MKFGNGYSMDPCSRHKLSDSCSDNSVSTDDSAANIPIDNTDSATNSNYTASPNNSLSAASEQTDYLSCDSRNELEDIDTTEVNNNIDDILNKLTIQESDTTTDIYDASFNLDSTDTSSPTTSSNSTTNNEPSNSTNISTVKEECRSYSIATCENILLRRPKEKIYHDNELSQKRPLPRRTWSYPVSQLRFSDLPATKFMLLNEKDMLRLSKKVRFADAFGFDLTQIQMIDNQEDPPRIPSHVWDSLCLSDTGNQIISSCNSVGGFHGHWKPTFPQLTINNQIQLSMSLGVALETVRLDAMFLDATVLVKNMGHCKNVFARLTSDNWISNTDYHCQFVNSQLSNNVDRFSLKAFLSDKIKQSDCLQFAICFQCEGQTFWDNNQGNNYRFDRSYQ